MKSQYTFDIGRIDKPFTVNWDKYPDHVKEYFVMYGLKKGFNDKLSGESLEAYRAINGNGDKSQADFVEYTLGLIGNIHSRMLAGEVSAPRASSGGSVYGEVRAIIKANYSIRSKMLAVIRDEASLLVFCVTRITAKLGESGQKFSKVNVEYGAGKLAQTIMDRAVANMESRGGLDEPDINDMK